MKKYIPTSSRIPPVQTLHEPDAEPAIPLNEMLVLQRNGEAVQLTPAGIRSYDDPESDEIDVLSSLNYDRLDYMQHISKLEKKARNAASKDNKGSDSQLENQGSPADPESETAENSD
ncbi:hypothetical protein [Dipodfec virus RodF1_49]|uniref:Uncharacterized protein n=1 Tax=Dipodfec virus RodF1_49 TaxID=2929299 RepID=A0A976R7X6_9VIRU|nr:hypothetical protein [Dipodfec virus RodF1_49]